MRHRGLFGSETQRFETVLTAGRRLSDCLRETMLALEASDSAAGLSPRMKMGLPTIQWWYLLFFDFAAVH